MISGEEPAWKPDLDKEAGFARRAGYGERAIKRMRRATHPDRPTAWYVVIWFGTCLVGQVVVELVHGPRGVLAAVPVFIVGGLTLNALRRRG